MSQSDHLYLVGKIYYCWYYDAQGVTRRKSTKCRDKRAAAAFLARLERAAQSASETARDATPWTVDDAVNWFVDNVTGIAPQTVRMYIEKGAQLVRLLGAIDVSMLSLPNLRQYIKQRESIPARSHAAWRSRRTFATRCSGLTHPTCRQRERTQCSAGIRPIANCQTRRRTGCQHCASLMSGAPLRSCLPPKIQQSPTAVVRLQTFIRRTAPSNPWRASSSRSSARMGSSIESGRGISDRLRRRAGRAPRPPQPPRLRRQQRARGTGQ